MFRRRCPPEPRAEGGQAAAGVLVATAALALAATGTALKGDFPFLAPAKEAVCRYNQALLVQAYDLFTVTRARKPRDLAELLEAGFRRPPRCPSGGQYLLLAEGEAACSFHDRRGPRVETLGVFRSPADLQHGIPAVALSRPADRSVLFHARWERVPGIRRVEVRWTSPDGRRLQTTRPSPGQRVEISDVLRLAGSDSFPGKDLGAALPPGEYCVALYLDGELAGNCSFWLVE